MIVFCHVPWLAEWSNQPVHTRPDLKGLGGWNEETWNVERANVQRRTWDVRTSHLATGRAGTRPIRLFVPHSLTAGMRQERANVRMWNVERECRRARVATLAHGARPHSFIRSPFVDSGDEAGTWNVERGNVERANVRTWNTRPTLEVSRR